MPQLPYQWRQTEQEVIVSLLVRNVHQDKLEVEIEQRECHISILSPTGAEIIFVLDPLFHGVDPARSFYRIHPSSLDVHLVKSHPGQHWQYLDDGDQPEHLEPAVEPLSPSIMEEYIPIQIMSDLHLELFFPRPAGIGVQPGYSVFECTPSARVLALLGDIGLASHGGLYDFLERQLHKYRHIFYVIGTHEGYQTTYNHARTELKDFASRIRAQRLSDPTLGTFILLDRTRYDLTDNVTVLGCTLWSALSPTTLESVSRDLADFRLVHDWTAEDYTAAHAQDLQWIVNECATIKAREAHRRVIVLTHHAPTRYGTSAPNHVNSPVTHMVVATDLVTHPVWAPPITLWAFGQTHYNSDQMRNGIRVVSNQRGYEGMDASSSGFSPQFCVWA